MKPQTSQGQKGRKRPKQTRVTCYLLNQQLRWLEPDFVKEGGLRERMTRARLAERTRQN